MTVKQIAFVSLNLKSVGVKSSLQIKEENNFSVSKKVVASNIKEQFSWD